MSRKTRKLMWSLPLIAAVAVIGTLAAFMMLTPGALFADGKLSQPGLMAPEAEGPRSIKITWTAPAGATPTGYRIDVSKLGHVWSELEANYSGTEYIHTLMEGDVEITGNEPVITARYYRVFARNSHGVGDESDIKRGNTKGVSAPDPVETVTTSATGPNSIRVTWAAPADDGGMSITEYRVVQSDGSSLGTTPDEIATGKKAAATATSMTVDELLADTQYYFRVYAVNKVGTGEVGVPAGAKTNKASRPDAPTGLAALQVLATSPTSDINLYWLEPARNGGRPITDYIVEFRVNSFQWQTVELDFTNSDLLTGGEAAENYVHGIMESTNPLAATDRPLEQGDRVSYKVYAKHADATSRGSSTTTVTMLNTEAAPLDDDEDLRPGMPIGVKASLTSDTPGRIELTWTHGLRTGYRIDVSTDGNDWNALESSTKLKVEPVTGTTRRYIHNGLTPGAMRFYRVFASDGGLLGIAAINEAAGVAGSAEAPAAVGSRFTATPVSATQINLAWSAPTDTGGRDIRRYLLEIGDAPLDAAELTGVPVDDVALIDGFGMSWVSETSYQHKGLEPDTRYYYRLRSDNSNTANTPVLTTVDGDGAVDVVGTITPVKDAAQQTAKTDALSAPAVPHSLSAHQGVKTSSGVRSEQGVYLTWLTANAAGGPVDEYEIMRVVPDEDDLEVSVPASDVNARTFYNDDDTQGSLDNKERRYRVRALNEAGESAWTDWATYPLADDHMHNMAPAAGAAIADQTVAVGATVMVQSTISDADTGDTLTYTAMSDMEMYATATVDTMGMVTITGVAVGMATITVTATDAAGAMATQDIMVTVEAADMTPSSPSNVMAH